MRFVQAISNFFTALGEIPSTFWGVVILILSMYIACKYNSDIGYYFAGVGSTLCGINKDKSTNVINSPKADVKTDASNQPGTN